MYAEFIQIQDKKIYNNKTLEYLQPLLACYGKGLEFYYYNVKRVAFGIDDFITVKCNSLFSYSIFILLENNGYLQTFLNWCKNQYFYQYDYVYDNILKGKYHMLVLSIPEYFKKSFDLFLEGKYSQMFSEKEIDIIFLQEEKKYILKKNPLYKDKFISTITENFGSWEIENSVEWEEFDFPPNKKQEIFNYHLSYN